MTVGDQTRFESMTKDVIRVHQDPCALDGAAWNALLDRQSRPTPFMRWEYLAALHASGSAVPRTGWAPRFVTVHRGAQLQAAGAAYLKSHSYGEYVFDWAWADAYQRHGLRYYPKLLVRRAVHPGAWQPPAGHRRRRPPHPAGRAGPLAEDEDAVIGAPAVP
jgi:predicted N-acyltransferase